VTERVESRKTPPPKFPPVCGAPGCGAPLSSRDIANGYKFHTEECYYLFIGSRVTKFLDDPTKFPED
jgi:hypothetical protein